MNADACYGSLNEKASGFRTHSVVGRVHCTDDYCFSISPISDSRIVPTQLLPILPTTASVEGGGGSNYCRAFVAGMTAAANSAGGFVDVTVNFGYDKGAMQYDVPPWDGTRAALTNADANGCVTATYPIINDGIGTLAVHVDYTRGSTTGFTSNREHYYYDGFDSMGVCSCSFGAFLTGIPTLGTKFFARYTVTAYNSSNPEVVVYSTVRNGSVSLTSGFITNVMGLLAGDNPSGSLDSNCQRYIRTACYLDPCVGSPPDFMLTDTLPSTTAKITIQSCSQTVSTTARGDLSRNDRLALGDRNLLIALTQISGLTILNDPNEQYDPRGDMDDDGDFDSADLAIFDARCIADVDGSGVVDSSDFYTFLGWYFTNDPRADFNENNTVDSQDFFDFYTWFNTPC